MSEIYGKMITSWAAKYPRVSVVLVAGGFPISKDGPPQCEVYRIQLDVTKV